METFELWNETDHKDRKQIRTYGTLYDMCRIQLTKLNPNETIDEWLSFDSCTVELNKEDLLRLATQLRQVAEEMS